MFVYTMQPVVQPAVQLNSRLSNRFENRLNVSIHVQRVVQPVVNRFDNRLYRVNGVLSIVVYCILYLNCVVRGVLCIARALMHGRCDSWFKSRPTVEYYI